MVIIFSSQPFYGRYVRRSTANDHISPRIFDNSKLWPFFQGCLGAIDGSHIHLSPPAILQSLYRNRKGFLSQNCLFICDFNMLFTYILAGWEGSATDARVWADALAKGFTVPTGFYYLADAGYPHCKELLVPFRSVRYHLQEWGAAGVWYVSAQYIYYSTDLSSGTSPANAKEIFNLRHAQARNVIERIFGVLKQRFRILLLPPRYPLEFQPRIPAALCALQNFIQETDVDEGDIPTDLYQAPYEPFPSDDNNDRNNGFIMEDDDEGNSEVKLRRMNIANEMWESYLHYIADSDNNDFMDAE
jgi:DDE superfamily endonuclease